MLTEDAKRIRKAEQEKAAEQAKNPQNGEAKKGKKAAQEQEQEQGPATTEE